MSAAISGTKGDPVLAKCQRRHCARSDTDRLIVLGGASVELLDACLEHRSEVWGVKTDG